MSELTPGLYQHWRLSQDKDNILWATLDREGSTVNSLSRGVILELDELLDYINENPPVGVVILSGKDSGFIPGADINQFTTLDNEQEAFELVRQAQMVFDRLAALPMPVVALIDGFCLGGGLELALACHYRIASDSGRTRIGLPEVKLGVHPGWGGTVRLPRLIGPIKALPLMMSGRALSGRAAKKLGIVDAMVPTRSFQQAARHYVLKNPPRQKPGCLASFATLPLVRHFVGMIMRHQLSKQALKSHYPAPFMIIKSWVKYARASSDRAMEAEAHSIASLLVSDTSRELVRIFFLQERLKRLGKQLNGEFQHVHVIGAGVMGGDIAAWCALQGMRVTLQDQAPEQLARAMKRARKLFQQKLKVSRLVDQAMDRLQPDIAGDGVGIADVVIEAVFEDVKVKQEVLRTIEPRLKADALLATNTSSLPLEEISTALKAPDRLIGIHFFNPVAKMLLVEIVKTQYTAEQVVQHASTFVANMKKLPLPVTSSPGFLVNRVLMPYLLEAMSLLEEGFSREVIDREALKFGIPMGPLALADKVGLDICLSAGERLVEHYGRKIPTELRKKVKAGELGCKTGKGFYRYLDGKAAAPRPSLLGSNLSVQQRLIQPMIDEAKKCLEEGVVADGDLLDAGMIFGTGFAPFRGGPIRYSETEAQK